MIRQGDVYWLDLGDSSGSRPAYLRPVVVLQSDLFNRSRIATVVVAAVTSNLRRAAVPGNLLLDTGEANLPKRSVVNVSELVTVDKDDLVEKIGALSAARMRVVLDGLYLLFAPGDPA